MSLPPPQEEWDVSAPANAGRGYLVTGLSYEAIVAQLSSHAKICRVWIKRYEMPARDEAKNARQICFLVEIGIAQCDLLYNAPDGLRGRYWQLPEAGFLATRHLIDTLKSSLLEFVAKHPIVIPPKALGMSSADVGTSLTAPSAKVWVRERDDGNKSLLELNAAQIVVPRWAQNEAIAIHNQGMWRFTPTGSEIEIKGAIIGPNSEEYVPAGKQDRSCQIHRFGFT